jgi:hypothetical protein
VSLGRAWKDFVTELVTDPRPSKGDNVLERPELLLEVAEHAVGEPWQALDANRGECRMIQWPDGGGRADQ